MAQEAISRSNSASHRRRSVAFLSAVRLRTIPEQIVGAMEWGKHCDWEMIDLSPWDCKLPEGFQPDGLIALDAQFMPDLINGLHAQIPVGVVIDTYRDVPLYPCVVDDSIAIGHRAAEYFLQRGFRNCAFCCFGQPQRSPALSEFEERVKQSGGTCATINCHHLEHKELTRQGSDVKRQLAGLTLPLAIFCITDRLAVRLCRWCLEMGIAVPEQAAILGVGNDTMTCELGPVPISSIDMQPRQRGVEAAKLLQRLMDGEPPPAGPLRVPIGDVVTRRSTDILAVANPDAARALRFIWDHYQENIGVEDIATACGINYRTLARHFHAALGRSVVHELIRQRLLKARQLLASGDLPVAEIAALAGYRSPQYFNEQFKSAHGVSPQAYRRRERKARRSEACHTSE